MTPKQEALRKHLVIQLVLLKVNLTLESVGVAAVEEFIKFNQQNTGDVFLGQFAIRDTITIMLQAWIDGRRRYQAAVDSANSN